MAATLNAVAASGTFRDASNTPIAIGTIRFQMTDANDGPIPSRFRTARGQVLSDPFSYPIVDGGFAGAVSLSNPAESVPLNLRVRITVRDLTTNKETTYRNVLAVADANGDWDLATADLTPALPTYLEIVRTGPQGPPGSPGSYGPTIKTATQLGCTADGTDCAALINNFFASASASNPRVLHLDAPGLIAVSGIVLSPNGYCSIVGMGPSTGFYLLSGAYKDVIAVGYNATVDPGGPAPAINAQYVMLKDFRIDGNRAGQFGNSASGAAAESGSTRWTFGINIVSCKDVQIEGVTVEHASTYSIRLSNVSRVRVAGCRLMAFLDGEAVVGTNTDGVHLNGPWWDIIISDCHFVTGDDGIAANLPEGYSGPGNRLAVSNCTFAASQTFVRLYGIAQLLDLVSLDNLVGTANVCAFVIGIGEPHANNELASIRNVSISGVNVTSPRFMLVGENIGSMQISHSTWSEAQTSVGLIQTWNSDLTISNLTVTNCRFLRDALGNSQISVIDTVSMSPTNRVNVLHLSVDGLAVDDLGAGTTPHDYGQISVLNLNPTTFVQALHTAGMSTKFSTLLLVNGAGATAAQHIAAFAGGAVSSTDLLHMLPVPDAIIYLGTMYYSLDHGNALSIANYPPPGSSAGYVPSTIGATAH